MTGLRASRRGSSLTSDWSAAARTSGPCQIPVPTAWRRAAISFIPSVSGVRRVGGLRWRVGSASRAGTVWVGRTPAGGTGAGASLGVLVSLAILSALLAREALARGHLQVLDDRAEREGREVGQRADDHDRPDQQADPEAAGRREGAEARRHAVLADHRAGDRHR